MRYLEDKNFYSVEWYIILAHKLIKLHIVRVLPPLFPIIRITRGDWHITNRCIKPHIENLHIINDHNLDSNLWWTTIKYRKTKKDTLSLYFSCGTGTPHLRSLVIQRVFSPSLSHAYVAWIAFWLQDPAIEVLFMYSSNWSFSSGSSRNKWSVSLVRGVAWHTCLQRNFCYENRPKWEYDYIFLKFQLRT